MNKRSLAKLTLHGSFPDDKRVSFSSIYAALASHVPLLKEVVLRCLFLDDDDVASLAVLPALWRGGYCGLAIHDEGYHAGVPGCVSVSHLVPCMFLSSRTPSK